MAPRAPSAPQAGSGTGNIPYAKGMVSGTFGPKPGPGPSDPGASSESAGAPSAPAQAAPAGGGQPPPMAAPPMAAANPFLDPSFYFDVMGSIMGALVNAANSETQIY